MNITINLNDSSSLDKAIAQLERLRFDDMCEEVCKRLAELGRLELESAYAGYIEGSDISVTIQNTSTGCVLSAHGERLGFIEFGTGMSHPLAESATGFSAPAHGTYGKGNGKRPSWTYLGEPDTGGTVIATTPRGNVVRTSGNDPADGFTRAARVMQENFSRICKEVFGV